jgi:hypothetical protein
MKFSINQLAIASYWLVAGKDGRVDGAEAHEGWDALEYVKIFEQNKDDWELVKSLYVTGNLQWDEITGFVVELPLLTRYYINKMIVHGVKRTKGKDNRDVDSWPALEKFCEDVGIHIKAYNIWAKSKIVR